MLAYMLDIMPLSLSQILVPTILLALIVWAVFWPNHVYLVDFVCYRPPDNLRVTASNYIEHFEVLGGFDVSGVEFQRKVLERSGISDEACMPLGVHELPVDGSLDRTRQEIELVFFQVVEDLLTRQRIRPKDIDIVVSNCSLFCPTPSITSMIMNRFGFRSNVKSVSLSGMGCSAGILAISLARDLLKVNKNSTALVLSMEAVNPNGYLGKAKSMLLANTLFRMGGAAILLSNRKQDRQRAKYRLQHVVRVHTGWDDTAYGSVFQDHDDDGYIGVALSKALVRVAGAALKMNVSKLGLLVLPYSEQIRYVRSMILRRWTDGRAVVPNFRKAFEHFCIHAGGRAVVDAVAGNLCLDQDNTEASRMTLYRFGNTSSSSVWYELAYLEAKGKVRKGDRVWQIAFGSGFKCNSAVWKRISEADPYVENAWSDRIHRYPVEVPSLS
ncbi:hypothetical protein MLD38_013400 [Melastoma candidum]|uniref:Uncharacterized protein n=1 Tax=Melastoma candidum TaxID=119954 RepID=A0ACB9RDM4_9MYRT|nr:hypothetical protein MLD38_013400 [Melastoma candidum]